MFPINFSFAKNSTAVSALDRRKDYFISRIFTMKKRAIFHEIGLENKNTLSTQDPLSKLQSPIPPKLKKKKKKKKKKKNINSPIIILNTFPPVKISGPFFSNNFPNCVYK